MQDSDSAVLTRETYGFSKILQPLLENIKCIKSQGIAVKIKGQTHYLNGAICLLTTLFVIPFVGIWKVSQPECFVTSAWLTNKLLNMSLKKMSLKSVLRTGYQQHE